MSGARARKPTEVFLSHAHSDRKFVNRLVKILQENGIRYWYSKAHLVGAQQWQDEIGRALDRCDWFAIVLSPAATRSEWVKRELRYVLNEDKYRGRIVPLLIHPCDHKKLSWTLGAFQFVTFTQDFGRGCNELLRVWGRMPRHPARRKRGLAKKKPR